MRWQLLQLARWTTGVLLSSSHDTGVCRAVLCRLMPCAPGADAAAAYVAGSGIKLCALGADGQVLQQAGLQVGVGADAGAQDQLDVK